MHALSIRAATEQDATELADLYAELHEFHVRHLPDRLRQPDAAPGGADPALEQHIRRIIRVLAREL